MAWIVLACAVVYLVAGLCYACMHPEETIGVVATRRIMGISAGLGALFALLLIWPLILLPRKR